MVYSRILTCWGSHLIITLTLWSGALRLRPTSSPTILSQDGIRLEVVGQSTRLPPSLGALLVDIEREQLAAEKAALSRNPSAAPGAARGAASLWSMTLVLALSYGGRDEITNAARRLAESVIALPCLGLRPWGCRSLTWRFGTSNGKLVQSGALMCVCVCVWGGVAGRQQRGISALQKSTRHVLPELFPWWEVATRAQAPTSIFASARGASKGSPTFCSGKWCTFTPPTLIEPGNAIVFCSQHSFAICFALGLAVGVFGNYDR